MYFLVQLKEHLITANVCGLECWGGPEGLGGLGGLEGVDHTDKIDGSNEWSWCTD